MQKSQGLRVYRWLRWPLLLLAVAGLIPFAAWRLTQPDILQWDDTVEYWAAGRLNAMGQNPYDPEAIHRLERQAGRPLEVPLMMWNPPWLLALVMPLGLLPYPFARSLWFLLHLTVVLFAIVLIGKKMRSPSPLNQGLAVLAGFSFGPTLYALKIGHVTPLMLLAPLGFLVCLRRQRWGLAGAMAALGLIKPHLLYLFLVAVFLDALAHRRWTILLGFTGAVALSSGLATAANPRVWEQYVHAVAHYPPKDWATPTLGGLLRFLLGVEHFWLQFLPPALGLLWLLFYWHRHRHAWQWDRHILLLVMVSSVTAAYGWTSDLLLTLIAVIPLLLCLVEIRHRTAAVVFLSAYLVIDAISLINRWGQFSYVWMAPSLLVWYLIAERICEGRIQP